MASPVLLVMHFPFRCSFPDRFPKLFSSSISNGFISSKGGAFLPFHSSLLPKYNDCPFPFLLHSISSPARKIPFTCFCNAREESESSPPEKSSALDWPILERWDVPWQLQTVQLTMFACGLRAMTTVVLGVIYGITNTFRPFPNDIFCYDLKEPFKLQNGWLLWAGLGLLTALIAVALTGFALSFFNGGSPERETDALVRLLPLIGSSSISTVCLIAITGVLAPLLEETVFRGFLMVSLTKWQYFLPNMNSMLIPVIAKLPTPVCVLITAGIFALAHLTPGEFPQLFVLGTILGFSYAQTRNLLTPITIHAFWNSGVIILLTFLQLQGFNIRELLQASS